MSRLLPRFTATIERIHDHRQLNRILGETPENTNPTPPTGVTAPGDTRRLRGIPCIARGTSGASPGTLPHADGARNVDRQRHRLGRRAL